MTKLSESAKESQPMTDTLAERLRKDHDDLQCLVNTYGSKTDAEKAAEIERAMNRCWEAAAEIERLTARCEAMAGVLVYAQDIIQRSEEELRLIHMKDCGVIYDTTLRVGFALAVGKIRAALIPAEKEL